MEQAKLDILVIDMQMGCTKAFDHICRYFHTPLLRFSFKICGHEQLAHDAVQNSWLKVAQSIKSLKDPRAFKCWVYQIVRRQTLDLLKKPSNEIYGLDVDNLHGYQHSVIEVEQSTLLALIDSLAEIDRQAIYLFYLEQMTLNEIAVVIDKPVGTVKSRLNRARKCLKEKLELKEKK